jgi:hypothetical protein
MNPCKRRWGRAMSDQIDVERWRKIIDEKISQDKKILYGILLSILDTLVDIKREMRGVGR